MAKQIVNIGSAPNDNTGDLVRDAFDKVNQNFDEVYSSFTMSGELKVGNSTVNSTTNSTSISLSDGVGTSVLSASNLTIGTTVVGINGISANDITINGNLSVTGTTVLGVETLSTVNMTVTGNLYVLGSTTTVNTSILDVADLNITIAKNATTPLLANGAGITIAGANATINYYNASNNINFSHSLAVGNVSSKFVKVYNITPDNGSGSGGTNDMIPAGAAAAEITDYTNTSLFSTAGIYNNKANSSLYLLGNYNSDVLGEFGVDSYANYDGSNNFVDGAVSMYAQYADSPNNIFSNYSLFLDESAVTSTWNFGKGIDGSVVEIFVVENNPVLYLNTSNGTVSHNTYISAQTITIDSTLIANSTGPYGKTEGSLNVNNAVTANDSSYLGGVAAAVYVQNSDSRILSGNLNFTGANNVYDTGFKVGANIVVTTSTITVGNATVNTVINATSFSGTANNANNLGGVAAASYVQNTDSRVLSGNLNFTGTNNIFDTGFSIGANVIVTTSTITVGNSTVNTVTNATSFSGTANNATNLGGVAAASYVQNTDSRTLSGNLTFTGANLNITGTNTNISSNVYISAAQTTIVSNTLNLGTSTVAANGHTMLPNGLKMAFGYVAANSTTGDATYASAFTTVYSLTVTPVTSGLTFNATTNTTVAAIRTSLTTTAANVYYIAIGI